MSSLASALDNSSGLDRLTSCFCSFPGCLTNFLLGADLGVSKTLTDQSKNSLLACLFVVNEVKTGSQSDGCSNILLLQGPSHPAISQGLAETFGLDPDPRKRPCSTLAGKGS